MLAQLPRWLNSSIYAYFAQHLQPLRTEGQVMVIKAGDEYFELRIEGPFEVEHDALTSEITLLINILIQCDAAKDNIYVMQDRIGTVASLFVAIPVYADNGLHYYGCLQRVGSLRCVEYGQVAPDVRVRQAFVEGQYRMVIGEQNGSN